MTIYDFGMNNGDDIAYYLKKSSRVVGVEANPELCSFCTNRFSNEVEAGRLVVLNVALDYASSAEPSSFYINKGHHAWGQLGEPAEDQRAEFSEILVPRMAASEIIGKFGEPEYVKIDLEGLDDVVLEEMLGAGIRPPLISTEVHTIEPFGLLVSYGYTSFNLVDGYTVGERYFDATISTNGGRENWQFPRYSSGPFGNDLTTPWISAQSMLYLLGAEGLGWKDVHASRIVHPDFAHQRTQFGVKSNLHLLKLHSLDLLPSITRWGRLRLRRGLTERNS